VCDDVCDDSCDDFCDDFCSEKCSDQFISIMLNKHQYINENTLMSSQYNDSENLSVLTSICIVLNIITSLSVYLHNALITLSCFCCLCCSKIIATKLKNICDIKKNTCCSYCHKKHKSCKSVCKMFVKCCVFLTLNRFQLSFMCKLTIFLQLLMS